MELSCQCRGGQNWEEHFKLFILLENSKSLLSRFEVVVVDCCLIFILLKGFNCVIFGLYSAEVYLDCCPAQAKHRNKDCISDHSRPCVCFRIAVVMETRSRWCWNAALLKWSGWFHSRYKQQSFVAAYFWARVSKKINIRGVQTFGIFLDETGFTGSYREW